MMTLITTAARTFENMGIKGAIRPITSSAIPLSRHDFFPPAQQSLPACGFAIPTRLRYLRRRPNISPPATANSTTPIPGSGVTALIPPRLDGRISPNVYFPGIATAT
jgi:hypothetical protein